MKNPVKKSINKYKGITHCFVHWCTFPITNWIFHTFYFSFLFTYLTIIIFSSFSSFNITHNINKNGRLLASALTKTTTSTPALTRSSRRCLSVSRVPMAAPTNSWLLASYEAFGKLRDFLRSVRAIKATSSPCSFVIGSLPRKRTNKWREQHKVHILWK